MSIAAEELDAAATTLERLRSWVFAVKEKAAGHPNPDYLPAATKIAEQLLWGATALRRDAARVRDPNVVLP